MNKNKIITGITLVSLAAAGTLAYAADSSSTTTTWATTNTANKISLQNEQGFGLGRGGKMWGWMMGEERWMWMGMGKMAQLTDEEKTALTTMTVEQRQAFMKKKRTENEAKRDAHEAVIDKLLNWQILTDAEKKIVEEIKTERAKMKEERVTREKEQAVMKTKMETRQALIAKVKAGQTLTADEQKQLVEEFGNGNTNGRGKLIHQGLNSTTSSTTTTTK